RNDLMPPPMRTMPPESSAPCTEAGSEVKSEPATGGYLLCAFPKLQRRKPLAQDKRHKRAGRRRTDIGPGDFNASPDKAKSAAIEGNVKFLVGNWWIDGYRICSLDCGRRCNRLWKGRRAGVWLGLCEFSSYPANA